MGFFVSPGVYVKEKDLSNLIPNLATTTAALVGWSAKGDVDNVMLITTPKQFVDEYGQPTVGQYFHYSALAYLENGNKLYALRVHNGAKYGGVKIMQSAAVDANAAIDAGASAKTYQDVSGEDICFEVFGKDPGTWNNLLGVRVTNSDADEYTFHIEVYQTDADGVESIVEDWEVSRKTKIDGYGKQMNLEERINGYSAYIAVADNTSVADTVMPKEQVTTLDLALGSNGSALTDPYAEVSTGWTNNFTNPDDYDVRILINGGYASTGVQGAMKTIAEARKDCLAIFDMPYAQISSVTSMVTWRTTTQNYNSSYCALYAPWVKVYDQFNDIVATVPPSGYVGGQLAYNDYVADPWYAPAGFNRGLLNVLGITTVFTQGERDTLYAAGINPLQSFKGQGNVIWGQKTEQTKASALDRVNVRRLLIVLEKSISVELYYFAFEPNNQITRFRITALIEEYLDTLSAKGAFQIESGDRGYRVVCDTSNNTPAVIDSNELHVDVYIKPSRAAEYIQLQAIITSSGASFEELIAKGFSF